MNIRFVKDWHVYRKGQIVNIASSGLGKGPATDLILHGFAIEVSDPVSVAGYQTMTMQPVQTMIKKRGRPVGSKNKVKVR